MDRASSKLSSNPKSLWRRKMCRPAESILYSIVFVRWALYEVLDDAFVFEETRMLSSLRS